MPTETLNQIPIWPLAAAGGSLLVLGLLLGLGIARRRVVRRVEKSRRIGRRGADRALALLDRAGFRVLDREVTAAGRLRVDGVEVEYVVRADAVVRRFFRRYVAEFKGGPEAARIENRSTRRQLLEYAVLFGCAGVLLVDANEGTIRRIEFPFLP